ncbi:hypothetical protein ACIBG8_19370 [Nonomuraea sp. NPDC050556]|uniref:hypothetical protein n=1 Tax=Nonomuraea sp. NPDC050556 TaxID=3364369 RepID=UPI00379E020F
MIEQRIKMRVTETVTYEFCLDPEDLDELMPEVLGDSNALLDYLIDNEDLWIDECNDSNFDCCHERDIAEVKVMPLLPVER